MPKKLTTEDGYFGNLLIHLEDEKEALKDTHS